MSEIYKAAYTDFWVDGGDWYLDLCYNPNNLAKELSRSRSHYFFVELRGETIGIIKYDFPFSPRQIEIPNAMKLHRLYLSSAVHGSGTAAALMTFIEQIALKNKLDFIWLEAMMEKVQSKRFYEKMGYDLLLTYQLDFEQLKPGHKGIHIYKKSLDYS